MNRLMGATIIFSLFFIALFLMSLFNLFDIGFTFSNIFFNIIFVMACAGIVLISLNIYLLFLYRRYKVDEHKQSESNVRDYYRYKKLMEPPSMDT